MRSGFRGSGWAHLTALASKGHSSYVTLETHFQLSLNQPLWATASTLRVWGATCDAPIASPRDSGFCSGVIR